MKIWMLRNSELAKSIQINLAKSVLDQILDKILF